MVSIASIERFSLAFVVVMLLGSCNPVEGWFVGLFAQTPAPKESSDVADGERVDAPADSKKPTKDSHEVREWTDWYYDGPSDSRSRTKAARKAKEETAKNLFAKAGVDYPPSDLVLVGYKEEEELEVWASSTPKDALKRIATYSVCAASGTLGPKRKQGDYQVPEGFYTIDLYNPHSRFYLSMRISYPNKADQILGHRRPGNAIMIHGNCASIGCVAITDERIQELWVMTEDFRKQTKRKIVQAYMFPSRKLDSLLNDPNWEKHHPFWQNLKEGRDRFLETHRPLRYRIDRAGKYLFRD